VTERLKLLCLTIAVGPAALTLTAAQGPSVFAQTAAGYWEVTGVPGAKAPIRQCLSDVSVLARFEHRAHHCSQKVTSDSQSSVVIDYSCGGSGFGHSRVDLITPRSLRIETQGISNQLPFNYVLQARRIGDCPPATPNSRH
jgi:hypothetical protein